MSQSSKRPGARDISDLKARLGLKKTGPAPSIAAPGAPAPAVPPPGGIAPPPGAVPAPFGAVAPSVAAPPGFAPAAPPAPLQAPVPDASSDPFGAMNAMAQNAAVAAQPEMIVVNDGSAVESVAKQNKAASLGRTAAMVILPLIAGVVLGKIASNAGQYNQVIEDAKPILADVKTVRKQLTELAAVLDQGKKGGKFVTADAALTKSLAAVKSVPTNDELVYKSSLYHLDPTISREIYTFYSDIHTLNAMLKQHVREANKESKILQASVVKIQGFNPMAYGAILKLPSEENAAAGAQAMMRMVQLGGPICEGDTKPNPAGCGAKAIVGFGHRDDETGAWRVGKIAAAGAEGVPDGTVVLLDPSSKTVKQIVVGGQATLAEIAYATRIEAIESKVKQLNDTGKKIQNVLNEKSNESTKFSFGL